MIVVADTSPLNYLVLINQASLLPRLYSRIVIPAVVLQELQHKRTPAAVTAWLSESPAWLEVADSSTKEPAAVANLDAGEAAAITLALEIQADTMLIDELRGRQVARLCGIAVSGTLGVLQAGHLHGWIDGKEALRRLRETNFRCSKGTEYDYLRSLSMQQKT